MKLVLDEKIVLGESVINKIIHGTLDSSAIAAKTGESDRLLEKEKDFLEDCKHPNVVRLKAFMRVGTVNYLIMEFALEGNLYQNLGLGKFKTARKRSIVEQISSGLEFIHFKNILHKDIRAKNVLLMDSNRVVISDFAMAQKSDASRRGTNTNHIVTDEVYTSKSDIVLLGLLAVQIFADRKIVDKKDLCIEAHRVQREEFYGRIFGKSTWAWTISNSLDLEPDRRPTAAAFRRSFSD